MKDIGKHLQEATVIHIPEDAACIVVGEDSGVKVYVPHKEDLNDAQAFIAVVAAVIDGVDRVLQDVFSFAMGHVYKEDF